MKNRIYQPLQILVICLFGAAFLYFSVGQQAKNNIQPAVLPPTSVSAPPSPAAEDHLFYPYLFTTRTQTVHYSAAAERDLGGVTLRIPAAYQIRTPLTGFEQASLVWTLSFEPVVFESLTPAENQLNAQKLAQLQNALETNQINTVETRFSETIANEAVLYGYLPDAAEPSALTPAQTLNALAAPARNLCGLHTVSATALVSVPSLNLMNVPVLMDGYLDTAFVTYQEGGTAAANQKFREAQTRAANNQMFGATEPTRQPTVHQTIYPPSSPSPNPSASPTPTATPTPTPYENCDRRLGCNTPTVGACCAAVRMVTYYEINCGGWVSVVWNLPPGLGANCMVRTHQQAYRTCGQCNWTGILRRNCSCT